MGVRYWNRNLVAATCFALASAQTVNHFPKWPKGNLAMQGGAADAFECPGIRAGEK